MYIGIQYIKNIFKKINDYQQQPLFILSTIVVTKHIVSTVLCNKSVLSTSLL